MAFSTAIRADPDLPLTRRRKNSQTVMSRGTLTSGALNIQSVSRRKRTQLDFEREVGVMSVKSKRSSSEDPANEALLVLPCSRFKRRFSGCFKI